MGWTESHGADDGGRPIRIAVDFHVEGRGGSTLVRVVRSGLSASADWDEMYDALKDGWTYFLFNLDFHFRRHGGRRRTLVWRRHATDLDRHEVWRRLAAAQLVLDGDRSMPASWPPEGGATHRDPGGSAIELGGTHPVHPASARVGHHFVGVLPDLGDSIWFVELEGLHVGFWLSVYGDDDPEVGALQAALDEKAGTVLA